jgi:hypothetical protein
LPTTCHVRPRTATESSLKTRSNCTRTRRLLRGGYPLSQRFIMPPWTNHQRRYDRYLLLKSMSKNPNFRWCIRVSCDNGGLYEDGDECIRCGACDFEMCYRHQFSCPGTTNSRVTSMTASVITATRPFLIPKTGFPKTRSRVLAHIATSTSRKEKAVSI